MISWLFSGVRPDPELFQPHGTALHEDDAIVAPKPIIDNFLDLQSGCQLFDHHLLWNAVPTPILRDSFYRWRIGARWEIDDCQISPPALASAPNFYQTP